MILPSFKTTWSAEGSIKPRMQILEVRDKQDAKSVDPLAQIIYEREEVLKYDQDGVLEGAQLTISYERLTHRASKDAAHRNPFMASYTRRTNTVSLTSGSNAKGLVALDFSELKGQRIGTFFFNEIVQWVKQWPDAQVNSIELLSGQATKSNKARRNRFYERFNIVFDYKDPEHEEGLSRPMLARDLVNVETWKQNIQEVDVMAYLGALAHKADHACAELAHRQRAADHLIYSIRRIESKPLRWALSQWASKIAAWSVPLLVAGMVGLGIWKAFFS
jgi:hypothetical protein